jgi:hypothetical protein
MMFFIKCEITTECFIGVMLRRFCLLVIRIINLASIFIVIVIITLQLILENCCLSLIRYQHFFSCVFTYFFENQLYKFAPLVS